MKKDMVHYNCWYDHPYLVTSLLPFCYPYVCNYYHNVLHKCAHACVYGHSIHI